jgi:hypothetical protein
MLRSTNRTCGLDPGMYLPLFASTGLSRQQDKKNEDMPQKNSIHANSAFFNIFVFMPVFPF